MKPPTIYAARSARRWHRQRDGWREEWRSAASGIGTIGVLATGTGLGSAGGGPAEHRYTALFVALLGAALLAVAWWCRRRSNVTPPATRPRNDFEATVPVDRWRRR